MSAEGVAPEVSMKLTGYKSQGAYSRYNRAIEVQVRAAQRIAGDGTSYASNVGEETDFFKTEIVVGSEAEDPDEISPTKRTKLQAKGKKIMSVSAESVLQQTSQGPWQMYQIGCLIGQVSNVPHTEEVQHEHKDLPAAGPAKEPEPLAVITGDDDWLEAMNWDDYMQEFEKAKTYNYNPIKAVLGGIGAFNNCTLHFNIGGNLM